jgi:hypothetical protein
MSHVFDFLPLLLQVLCQGNKCQEDVIDQQEPYQSGQHHFLELGFKNKTQA